MAFISCHLSLSPSFSEAVSHPIPLSLSLGKVIHSHSYRHPEPFSGQSVVVLGAGASGLDISLELGRSNAQVTLSHGKPTLPFPLPYGVHQATPVEEIQEDGSLRFLDGSITQAQVLLLCTGYNFSYPFLEPARLGLEVQEHLVTPLYRFLMPPAFPSLFIIGICKIICPFPHFHCQVRLMVMLIILFFVKQNVWLPHPSLPHYILFILSLIAFLFFPFFLSLYQSLSLALPLFLSGPVCPGSAGGLGGPAIAG